MKLGKDNCFVNLNNTKQKHYVYKLKTSCLRVRNIVFIPWKHSVCQLKCKLLPITGYGFAGTKGRML